MMTTPIWSDLQRVAVSCFVVPDPTVPSRAIQDAICRRTAELLRARLPRAIAVAEVGPAEAAAALAAPGTVVVLVHARVQAAGQVIAGAPALLVTLAARLERGPLDAPAGGALFGAAPVATTLSAADRTGELDAALARLVDELLIRG